MFLRSFKVQLTPNNKQQTLLFKHLGCARWAYNWGLAKKIEARKNGDKTPSYNELDKEFNILKKAELPWMYESSSRAAQNALRDVETAFKNFFRRCKQGGVGKKGFPKFKSKKNEKQSFKLNGNIHVYSERIKLPNLGKIRLAQTNYIPTNLKILSVNVSLKAGKWFVSVLVEVSDVIPTKPTNDVVGVDLGIKTLATCSDETTYENPKALRKNLKKLKRLSCQLSRKKKDSKNREKAKKKLAKLHYRIANIRKDAIHKATTKIVNENQVIVLEDLNVSNMMKNRGMARSNSDVGYYEFRRQIEYKARWNKRIVIFVDTFYPSSKLCSCCGWKNNKLTLTNRVFKCEDCGLELDRDCNAAMNLKQYYLKMQSTGSLSGIEACGERSSLDASLVSCSLKQEFNRELDESLISVSLKERK